MAMQSFIVHYCDVKCYDDSAFHLSRDPSHSLAGIASCCVTHITYARATRGATN